MTPPPVPQKILDRLVTEDRARHVAELLFPAEVPAPCPDAADGVPCGFCQMLAGHWEARVRQVRAAIQATFPLPDPQSRPSQAEPQSRQSDVG